MAIKLFNPQTSMFCEKVRMVFALKKVPYEVIDVRADERKSLLEYTNQRKVPTLNYNGECVIDSTVISTRSSRHGCSRERVTAVLACARLGLVPWDEAAHRLSGTPPVLHTPDTEVPWAVLIRAGRTDPAPAPGQDNEGYETLMRAAYDDVFATLTASLLNQAMAACTAALISGVWGWDIRNAMTPTDSLPLERADLVRHDVEQLVVALGHDLREDVEAPRRDDDVVELVHLGELRGDLAHVAVDRDPDHRLSREPHLHGVGDGDDLHHAALDELLHAMSDGRL